MKTRKEIIDETVAAYTLNTRAFTYGSCRYLTDYGNMCAVGRCCTEPKLSWRGSCTAIKDGSDVLNLGSELKPEYRGHPAGFWLDIQLLHDMRQNWTYSGLSAEGVEAVADIYAKWGEA